MARHFEWLVGLRYTRAKRRNNFISVFSFFSVAGITLGVAALIVVLSVMNGFQQQVRSHILALVSHVDISGPDNRLQRWREVLAEVRAKPEVVATAPYVLSEALLSSHGEAKGALVRGIDPLQESGVSDLGRHMLQGRLTDLQAGNFGVVIGSALADQLNVGLGDKIAVITPQGQMGPAGLMPRLKQFTVVGIFSMDMYQFDSSYAFIDLRDGQKLFRLDDSVSGIQLKLKDLFDAPRFHANLTLKTDTTAYARDWTETNSNWFQAVETEKTMMFIILTIIVIVASFNLVSTLVMVVTDKQADIAILRTMGATPGSILRIFLIQGTMIGVVGTLLGVGFGLLVAYNIDIIVPAIEHLIGRNLIPKETYIISTLPSEVRWADVLQVSVVSLTLSLVMTVFPSWRAAKVQPAEALRYE